KSRSGCANWRKLSDTPSVSTGIKKNHAARLKQNTASGSSSVAKIHRSTPVKAAQPAMQRSAGTQRSATWPAKSGAVRAASADVADAPAIAIGEKPRPVSHTVNSGTNAPGTAYCRNIKMARRRCMTNVGFRSAKARPFAERKATVGDIRHYRRHYRMGAA